MFKLNKSSFKVDLQHQLQRENCDSYQSTNLSLSAMFFSATGSSRPLHGSNVKNRHVEVEGEGNFGAGRIEFLFRNRFEARISVLQQYMTKQKENFNPNGEGKVRMYVCDVTAYDYSHIGHAWAYVAFDVLYSLPTDGEEDKNFCK